ncbi:Adenylate cyclase [Brevundimonas diminuta 3F5N]|uniref:histidine kinase n=1 Tax=Brevundimonas diminuta 3F5N TaxID=1255603 RepID=A0A1R4FSW3_BREDI|nr:CHASE2 domain-containing protein [Brevundimonas diminuta]SJM58969.1 Adenylate cyclase [Brevundimonas diminuta 3F5N]
MPASAGPKDGWRGWLGARLTGRRALVEWGLVAALSALLVSWMALTPVADGADHLVYDALMRAEAGPADQDIVIIAIDDRSLEALGQWPWPRDLHARLIDRLTQAGAGPVAYDVLFTEASPQDRALADALARNGKVRLPVVLDAPGLNGAAFREDAPAPGLTEAAAGLGHVNLTVDDDGAVRRLPLYLQAGQQTWPHLILPLAAARGVVPASPAPHDNGDLFAAAPEALIYRGPPGAFRTLSFADVLSGETPAAFLKDRLVLVGATAPGLGDRYATPATPHGELRPGVEVQAALLQTLIEGGGPRSLSPGWVLALSLLPLGLLVAGFLVLRPAANMALGAGLIIVTLIAAAFAFLACGLWFPPSAAVAGLALAYPLWSWRRLAAASAYMQSEVDAFERDGVRLIGRAQGGDVVARQVDALRAAVRQVRDLERFISDALRSLPDATVVADPHARIILSNDRAEALFGERLKDGADLPLLFQSLGEPAWRRFLDLEGDPGDITTPDGRILKAAASVLTDAEGQPVGHIVRFADMTRFRAAERQRAEALQLLSHDMRAPQVSILTLLDGPAPRLDPMVERRIADYARQTLDLAEGYVQLARAESQPYRSELLDLGQVAMDAADILWPQASKKGVRILTPDGEEEFLVQGDPALLRRLTTNLLDNALKYGPQGGVIQVSLTGAEEDSRPVCILSVSDQGPGLSEEAARRLFQAFGHGGADHRGAGLGLAFVRTVAERHGGTIRHQPGSPGATFILTLPRVMEGE